MNDDVGQSPRQEQIAPPHTSQQQQQHPFSRMSGPFLRSSSTSCTKRQQQQRNKRHPRNYSSSSTLSLSSSSSSSAILSLSSRRQRYRDHNQNHNHLNIHISLPTLSSLSQDYTPTSCYPSSHSSASTPLRFPDTKKKSNSNKAKNLLATPEDVICQDILHISIAGPKVIVSTVTASSTPSSPSSSSPESDSNNKKNLASRIIRKTLAFNQQQQHPTDSAVSSSDNDDDQVNDNENDKEDSPSYSRSPPSSSTKPIFPLFNHNKRLTTAPQLGREQQRQQQEYDYKRKMHQYRKQRRQSSISSRISWVTSPRPSPTTVYRHSIGKDIIYKTSSLSALSPSSSLSLSLSHNNGVIPPGRFVLLNRNQIDTINENMGDIHISLLPTPTPAPSSSIQTRRTSPSLSTPSTMIAQSSMSSDNSRLPRQRWTRDSQIQDLSRSSSHPPAPQ